MMCKDADNNRQLIHYLFFASVFIRIIGGQMLVTFSESRSALHVLDVDGVKVKKKITVFI